MGQEGSHKTLNQKTDVLKQPPKKGKSVISALLWAAGPPAQRIRPWGCKLRISLESFVLERNRNGF